MTPKTSGSTSTAARGSPLAGTADQERITVAVTASAAETGTSTQEAFTGRLGAGSEGKRASMDTGEVAAIVRPAPSRKTDAAVGIAALAQAGTCNYANRRIVTRPKAP